MNVKSKEAVLLRMAGLGEAALKIAPGVMIVIALSLFAVAIANFSGVPLMLLALVIGLVTRPALPLKECEEGLNFAAKPLLRLGVALLGAGVVASEIAALGWSVVALCVVCVAFTLAVGCATARSLRTNAESGLLFGGAVAICGASAALAISAALPQSEENDGRTLLAVIGVTVLSTMAMLLYPLIAAELALSDKAAGIFFGAAIHDVAQVVGAGYMYSEHAGETATMVKLVRIACLVPVVAMIAFAVQRAGGQASGNAFGARVLPMPTFLLGFVALSVLASSGVVDQAIMDALVSIGKALLVIAIVAMGCQTSLQAILKIGWGPVLLLTVPTIALAILVMLALPWLPVAR